MDRKNWDLPYGTTPIARDRYQVTSLHHDQGLWVEWIRTIIAKSQNYCVECSGKGSKEGICCDRCDGTGNMLTDLGETLVFGLRFLEQLQQRVKYRRSKR